MAEIELSPDTPLPSPAVATVYQDPPFRGNVLVLAPHPDDEAAGPGGALAAHSRLGDSIHGAFITSGVHGDPEDARAPEEYVALRRAEAEASAEVLGMASYEFWGLPDGCTVTHRDLDAVSERLLDLFGRLEPDVIYAPHMGESHSDHHFVALAAVAALGRWSGSAHLLGYEVWSPMQAHWVLDVTADYETKRAAVRCYPSQLRYTDIMSAIEGLNAYRAILLPQNDGAGHRRAEVYCEMSP
ncbi:MAG: LmbE family N-acetylglucosaminyl deacetylase [Pseudohongiellaceae bacterium]|jgi:LmbE family N-acetylglucosaminyl deacetylase